MKRDYLLCRIFPQLVTLLTFGKKLQIHDDDRLAYNCYESNSTNFFVTSTNSLSGIVDLERNQDQIDSSVVRGRTHHSVSSRISSAASVSFPRSLLCMTRYMYSAVATLIYSTVSYPDKADTSLVPHHRELMPEEFGSLIHPGGKYGWERQQVYGAKCTTRS